MPIIEPFRALRYQPERVGGLSRVLAPPYDVLSPSQQEQLYQASPHNVVRLTLGTQAATDTERDNRYTRARRDFDAWRASGVLAQDAAPALYLIEHTFPEGGEWRPQGDIPSAVEGRRTRLGFLALLRFTDSIERAVHRHEATLAAPKADRTKLLEAIPANLEPIFCVYPDEGRAVQTRLEGARTTAPVAEAALGDETVRMWMLGDPQDVAAIQRALEGVAVLIADGHHRFEVADANKHRYPALMAYFASMDDPGLVVRPIHRVVRVTDRSTLDALRQVCDTEPAADAASVVRWLGNGAAGGPQARFGLYDGRAFYNASVGHERLARWLMHPPVPLPLAQLDVSILHGLIFPQLGISATHGQAAGSAEAAQVTYLADVEEALQAVQRGEASVAWLLRGIPLPHVYALAAQGFLLPPKSTYFYPKVPSGLAMHLLAR